MCALKHFYITRRQGKNYIRIALKYDTQNASVTFQISLARTVLCFFLSCEISCLGRVANMPTGLMRKCWGQRKNKKKNISNWESIRATDQKELNFGAFFSSPFIHAINFAPLFRIFRMNSFYYNGSNAPLFRRNSGSKNSNWYLYAYEWPRWCMPTKWIFFLSHYQLNSLKIKQIKNRMQN